MRKGPFLPKQLTATQWSTQDDKAEFGNTLLHFIDSGFKQTLFTKKLYPRLSNTFGHIAHYNQGGFWAESFVEASDQVRFIEHLLRWLCYGDPEFTSSDVERALRQEVLARDYLSRYRVIADATLRAREVAVLEASTVVPLLRVTTLKIAAADLHAK
jgi:hypothetical protein